MTHTPGPWTLEPGTLRMVTGRAFDGSAKAIVELVRGGTPEEADANARLISTAPDLFAACDAVARSPVPVCCTGEHAPPCDCAGVMVRAAIAKAEGTS